MPTAVSEMSEAISLVTIERAVKTMPTESMIVKNLGLGHALVAGNTREKARKAAGIMQALAKVRRPHNSVCDPLSTPPMPSTQPVIAKVRIANHPFTELEARALHTYMARTPNSTVSDTRETERTSLAGRAYNHCGMQAPDTLAVDKNSS